jgi:hypothetical protein
MPATPFFGVAARVERPSSTCVFLHSPLGDPCLTAATFDVLSRSTLADRPIGWESECSVRAARTGFQADYCGGTLDR